MDVSTHTFLTLAGYTTQPVIGQPSLLCLRACGNRGQIPHSDATTYILQLFIKNRIGTPGADIVVGFMALDGFPFDEALLVDAVLSAVFQHIISSPFSLWDTKGAISGRVSVSTHRRGLVLMLFLLGG